MAHFAMFEKNWPHFGPEAKILKSKEISFLQLSKLNNIMYPYFFLQFWLMGKDMAIF